MSALFHHCQHMGRPTVREALDFCAHIRLPASIDKGRSLSLWISWPTRPTDIHFPVLTVRETLTFAAQNANASVAEFNDPQLDAMEAERPDRLIHMVGLEEAANTVIGNDLLRGVSGGQKKRVTIGELLITNARVHLLDEVSTGLDSAITFHIFNALRSICGHQRTSVVTALLQPTPETFGLFDEVILLREGEVVFHGKRERMRPYFRDVLNFPIPDDEDEAGFVVDYLTNPTILQAGQRKKQLRRAQRSSAEGYVSQSRTDYADDSKQSYSVSVVNGTKQPLEPPALETAVMVDRWRRSSDFVDLIAESSVALEVNQSDPKNALEPASWIPFTKKQFAADYPHSAFQHMRLCLHRQRLLTVRNKQVFMPRFFQAVLVGVIFGTLFYQLDPSDYNSRFGVTLYVCMYTAFSNLSELPVASEARAVVTKQLDASFFPSLPYVFSVIFMGIPIIVIEIIIFSLWMYWMTGFAAEAGRFFFFVFTLLSSSLALSTFFRSISYVTPNPDVARQLDLPFIIIFVIFGGFLIRTARCPTGSCGFSGSLRSAGRSGPSRSTSTSPASLTRSSITAAAWSGRATSTCSSSMSTPTSSTSGPASATCWASSSSSPSSRRSPFSTSEPA